MTLDEWNALDAADAQRELRQVCAAPRWAREVAASRPHPDVASLQAMAEVTLTDADLDEALSGHPRIGDQNAGGASRREQSGVAGADEELLDILRARLGNDPATERAVALAELAAINRLRIARLFAEDAA